MKHPFKDFKFWLSIGEALVVPATILLANTASASTGISVWPNPDGQKMTGGQVSFKIAYGDGGESNTKTALVDEWGDAINASNFLPRNQQVGDTIWAEYAGNFGPGSYGSTIRKIVGSNDLSLCWSPTMFPTKQVPDLDSIP